jgi:hypothetical protein
MGIIDSEKADYEMLGLMMAGVPLNEPSTA